jgi:hypothetical protein
VIVGKKVDARLFFFHRQASDGYDMTKPEQALAAVIEAAGPTAAWKDVDRIAEQWEDPTSDLAYLERTYTNRPVQASAQAFDAARWAELAEPGRVIPDGALVTLGFDGARSHDSTALVATEVATGHQQLVGLWEQPTSVAAGRLEDWEVSEADVDAAVAECFQRWDVWRMYADPPYWEGPLAHWRGRYGERRVIEWRTNRYRQMAASLQAYATAMATGELSHDGNPDFARHIGNACRRLLNFTDEKRQRMWVIQKETPGSPKKIDAGMAGDLSWEARNDAIAAGALNDNAGGVSLYVPGEEEEAAAP